MKRLLVIVLTCALAVMAGAVTKTIRVGGRADFSVTADGTLPFSYQWRKTGVPLTGQTAAAWIIPAVTPADSGIYDVVVTNAKGSTVSPAITLLVEPVAPVKPTNVKPAIVDASAGPPKP